MRALTILIVLIAGSGCSGQAEKGRRSPGPERREPQPKPQSIEALLIEELNLLRTEPARYARFLEERLRYYQRNTLRLPGRVPLKTAEGAAAVREAIRALRSTSPMEPVAYAAGLHNAARDHIRDIGRKGLVQHEGTDRSEPMDRVLRYAQGDLAVGEVISFGPDRARDVVIDLLVDDGVPGRGHRKLLLDPQFRFAGAACGPHKIYRTMCVIDMSTAYQPR